MKTPRALTATSLLCLVAALSPPLWAQRAAPATPAPPPLLIELHGAQQGHDGQRIHWTGTVFEVRGAATLVPRAGAELALESAPEGHTATPLAHTTTDAQGHFSVDFAFAPRVRLEARAGGAQRQEVVTLARRAGTDLTVLTDRSQYEPGEHMHVWVQCLDPDTRAPQPGQTVTVSREIAGRNVPGLGPLRATTDASGMAYLDTPLPESTPAGGFALAVEAGGQRTLRGISVGLRTAQPMTARLELAESVVSQGQAVRVRLLVRDAQGRPVQGAQAEVLQDGRPEPVARAATDAQGDGALQWNAAAYLSASYEGHNFVVRVTHPAWGEVRESEHYTLARTPWLLEARAGRGGLVPEVPSPVFLLLTRVGTTEPAADTPVTLTGPAVPGGTWSGRTDRHGVAQLSLVTRAELMATHQSGPCTSQLATSVRATVGEGASATQQLLCVGVSELAGVALELETLALAPGGTLTGTVRRGPRARGREVRLYLEHRDTVLASLRLGPQSEHFSWPLPAGLQGVVRVRARYVEQDAVSEGQGSVAAALVRPAPLALSVAPGQASYAPGGQVSVRVQAQGVQGPAWTALVARDVVARAGEEPFELAWLVDALDRAAADPATPDARRLLAAALAEQETDSRLADRNPSEPDPTSTQPLQLDALMRSGASHGLLLDPWPARRVWQRVAPGPVLRALEQGVLRALAQGDHFLWTGTRHREFVADAVERLFDAGMLDERLAGALGGGRITLAMVRELVPELSYDRVARRLARGQLVGLLESIASIAEPEAGTRSPLLAEPPERWLSWLVAHGVVEAHGLRDPWGGVFTLRPVRPATQDAQPVLTEALRGFRLVSPGPDGRWDTPDDVVDPRERVVPQGTLYALAVGEDRLMNELAMLAPGSAVLSATHAAYARVGSGAHEEEVGDVAVANDADVGSVGLGNIGTMGHGSGSGAGRGMGAARVRSAAPSVMNAGPSARAGVGALLGSRLRERFPATVWAVGPRPLDATGAVQLDFSLADAVSTYRVSAVAWSASGQAAVAHTSFTVQQELVLDAPVPRFATPGDEVVLPLRVQNFSSRPRSVRVQLEGRQGLVVQPVGAGAGEPTLTVAPGQTEVRELRVRLTGEGPGALRLALLEGQAVVDRVERPLILWPEGRPVRREGQGWGVEQTLAEVTVPPEALDRGLGLARVTLGAAVLGPLPELRPTPGESPYAVLVLRALGREPDLQWFNYLNTISPSLPMVRSALTVGAWWASPSVPDDDLDGALRSVSPPPSHAHDALQPDESAATALARTELRGVTAAALALLTAGHGRARPELASTLDEARGSLLRWLDVLAQRSDGGNEVLAAVAMPMALAGGQWTVRARELVRRLRRDVVQVGGRWFLPVQEDTPLRATAELAVAAAAIGDTELALGCLRTLAEEGRLAEPSLRLGQLAALRLQSAVANENTANIELRVDEQPPATHALEGFEGAVPLPALRRPGSHTVRVRAPAGTLVRLRLESHFSRRWQADAEGPFALGLEGEAGVRNGVSGLLLTVRNRSTRLVRAPLVQLELPAGGELEPTLVAPQRRAGLLTAAVAGRTLNLTLRPLGPGASVRVALPVRWALSGRVAGLAVAAYTSDALGAAMSVLPPRVLEVGAAPPAP